MGIETALLAFGASAAFASTTAAVATGVGAAAAIGGAASTIRQQRKAGKRADRAAAAAEDRPVDTAGAVDEVKTEQRNIRRRRVNLFETAGGVSGEELQPGQVSQRRTLLGN